MQTYVGVLMKFLSSIADLVIKQSGKYVTLYAIHQDEILEHGKQKKFNLILLETIHFTEDASVVLEKFNLQERIIYF